MQERISFHHGSGSLPQQHAKSADIAPKPAPMPFSLVVKHEGD